MNWLTKQAKVAASSFKLGVLEITSEVGWLVSTCILLVVYAAAPLAVAGDEGSFVRLHAVSIVLFLVAIFCITRGGRLGQDQVLRHNNLFFRAAGWSDGARFIGFTAASLTPLFVALLAMMPLVLIEYWINKNALWEGGMVFLQFASLFVLPVLTCVMISFGVSSRISAAVGTVVGLGLFITGMFLPPLISVVAGVGPVWLEYIWVVMPHFYALDWSPTIIYLWSPAVISDYLTMLAYGVGWGLAGGGLGLVFYWFSHD